MKWKVYPAGILLFGLLWVAGSSVRANEGTDSFQEINSTFDRYVQYWKTLDIKGLSSIYAPDSHVTAFWPDPGHGVRLDGWPQIKKAMEESAQFIPGMDLTYTDRKIELFDGHFAVLTSHWIWNLPPVVPQGIHYAFRKGRTTFIFVHRKNRWVLVHEHASVTPFLPCERSVSDSTAGPDH
jgi:ketosteroid isomerase-like protein